MTNRVTPEYFCSAPWAHLCIRPGSAVFPCCQFLGWEKAPKIGDGTIKEIFNHESLKALRKKMLDGEKIEGCQKCYDQDRSGHPSLRAHLNHFYPLKENSLNATPSMIKTMEIFLGDVCNLKCVMCHPNLSSSWREDFEKLGKKMNPRFHYNPKIEQVMSSLSSLEELKFVGGEPLLAEGRESILKAIPVANRKAISLDYNTNATIIPSETLIDLWSQFKSITIWLSIDGLGKINEFVRYPAKWDNVQGVTHFFVSLREKLPNISLKLIFTANPYNIEFAPELEVWMDKSGIGQFVFNPVMDPDFLSPLNLPQEYKTRVIEKLKGSTEKMARIAHYLESNDKEYDAQLAKYTRDICHVRSIKSEDYLEHLPFVH